MQEKGKRKFPDDSEMLGILTGLENKESTLEERCSREMPPKENYLMCLVMLKGVSSCKSLEANW